MKSIGFGVERIALFAMVRPGLTAVLFVAALALAGYGFFNVSFNDNLRNVFGGTNKEFTTYANATRQFVDPESEMIVLVEGRDLGAPEIFSRLRDFQFELQLIDGVGNVFSLFSLRDPPDAAGDAPLVVDDSVTGLSPALVDRVRAHPLLGSRLLSADATAMLYVVTPETGEGALALPRRIGDDIRALADELFADSDVAVTVTGFPAIRIGIVDTLVRDQRVLNTVGAMIGFLMTLIVFRSLTAAVMISVPAILSGLAIIGVLGVVGIRLNVMSNVVPVLVMILGYANSIHLCRAWRLKRDEGAAPADAARHAIETVGPACVLAYLTTAVAFLSLVFSDVQVVSDFGWVGAMGCIVGALIVLILHGLLAVAIGRFWKAGDVTTPTIIGWLAGPSEALGRFVTDHARALNVATAVLVVVFGAMYAGVKPEYSTRENLSPANPANAAIDRIDEKLGGSYPVHVIVPLGNLDPTSPEALEKIGAVHRALAGIEGIGAPLSLWNLVEWLDSGPEPGTRERLQRFIDEMAPSTRQRFLGTEGGTLVSASIGDAPTAETNALVDRIEAAVRAAGGNDVIVTGVTVVAAREATRTIGNLNLSLMGAIVSGILVILIAFRSWRVAVTSIVPNVLPLLGTGALLFALGGGLQFNGVLALTVAFGIAVDGTIHYLNHFFLFDADSQPLRDRLVATTRRVGPQLLGTTAVIVAGMATTQTSEMPTVALFGALAAVTLVFGLVGDLIVLPALMAGAVRQWFTRSPVIQPAARSAA